MAERTPLRPEPTIFSVYNYKGGVGKTTLLINLAARIAKKGHKTLIVDCDAQCNATDFFLGSSEKAEQSEIEDDSDLEAESEATEGDTREVAGRQTLPISIRQDHIGRSRETSTIDYEEMKKQYVSSPTIYQYLGTALTGRECENVQVRKVPGMENLWILPGDPNIIFLEEIFSDASIFRRRIDCFEGVGGFRYFLHQIAAAEGFAYIFVDLGPSSGLMNQIMVLNSDYILPPLFADFFSLSSADGFLNILLPKWLAWLKKYKEEYSSAQENPTERPRAQKYKFGSPPPRILPFLITNYAMQNKKVQLNYANWIAALDSHITRNTKLQEVKDLFYPDGSGAMLIVFCKHLHGSMRASHAVRKPIWALKAADYKKAVQSNAGKETAKIWKYAEVRYENLARFILSLPVRQERNIPAESHPMEM